MYQCSVKVVPCLRTQGSQQETPSFHSSILQIILRAKRNLKFPPCWQTRDSAPPHTWPALTQPEGMQHHARVHIGTPATKSRTGRRGTQVRCDQMAYSSREKVNTMTRRETCCVLLCSADLHVTRQTHKTHFGATLRNDTWWSA